MAWQRARSEEQKEQRISEIVGATARLYNKHRFEEISFRLIAREAGFTRSNLYKYFSCKEEIFLAFLKQDIIAWRKDLVKSFRGAKSHSVETFASLWVESLLRNRRLLDLLSVMPSFLEKHVTEESLVDFKRCANDELHVLSDLLCKTFCALTPAKVGEFVELQMATAIGLYQITNLSDVQEKVLEYPEFRHMKADFKGCLQKAVEYFLQGLTT